MLILLSFFIQLCASLKTIRVYADSGASDGSVSSIISTFNVLLPSSEYKITKIFATEILSKNWLNTTLLVFPGGMDLPYVAALNLKGYEIIRRYIDSGGNYLGAYFGSRNIEFEKATRLEVLGSRLDLVETRAIGSVTRNYRPNSESGAEIIPIEFNGEIIPLYVNGGPYFEPTDENQVVGYYNFKGKRLPAIMYKNSGLGKVVLCGAHFEFEHSHVDHNSRLWFTASILRLLDVKVYVD